jgi:hypothetical protein
MTTNAALKPAETYLTEQDHQRLYDAWAEIDIFRGDLPPTARRAVFAIREFLEETYRDDNSPVVLQAERRKVDA